MEKKIVLFSDSEFDFDLSKALIEGEKLSQLDKIDQIDSHFSNEFQPIVIKNSENIDNFEEFEKHLKSKFSNILGSTGRNKISYIFSRENIPDLGKIKISPIGNNFLIKSKDLVLPKAVGKWKKVFSSLEINEGLSFDSFFSSARSIQKYRLKKYSDKNEIIKSIADKTIAQRLPSSLASTLSLGVDELVVFSLFSGDDGSFAGQGEAALSENAEIELSGKNSIEVFFGYDEEYIGISVKDQKGTINKENFLRFMFKNLKDQDILSESNSGIGIGISMLFSSGVSFYVRCEENFETEIMIILPKSKSTAEIRKQIQFVSIHFFN